MTRWIRLLLAVLFVASLTQAVSSSARAQAEPLSVEFTAMDAVSSFPDGITFSVEFATEEPIQRVELLYRSDGDESFRLITVPVTDASARAYSYFLDLQIYYYPPGIDFLYEWRLTGENGASAESDEQRAPWIDSRFEWSYLETEAVRVASYSGGEEFAQTILDSAQRAVDRIQNDLGAELDQQVRIWAYENNEDFAGTKAPNSEEWSVGVAYPSLKVILAVLPPGNLEEVGRVIPHEISHQVIAQAIDNSFNGLPVWLDEGIAVNYQENGNSHFPGMVQEASDRGALFSVRALNATFPYDGNQATLGYAQSFSIVNFIRDTWGDEGLANLVGAYRGGVSHDEAALSALGVDLDELDRLWKESVGYQGDKVGATGVIDDGRSDSFWGGLFASGALIWVLIALLAVVAGIKSTRSSRRRFDEDDGFNAFHATFRH